MKIYPVIHYYDETTSISNAEIAFSHGCDGVFVINMGFEETDAIIPSICKSIKDKFPDMKIGANFLYGGFLPIFIDKSEHLDMLWTDNIIPDRYDDFIRKELSYRPMEIFESFAFKYKEEDNDFVNTGKTILAKGRIPTTSGPGTGQAPSLDKILQLKELSSLALASGLDPDNIGKFKNYITHALVATGISETFYKFDSIKVRDFVQAARG